MFSRGLVLILVLLFVFGIVEAKIIVKLFDSQEEVDEYKEQHPEVDWDAAKYRRWPRPKIDTAWQSRGGYKTGKFKIRVQHITSYREIRPEQLGLPAQPQKIPQSKVSPISPKVKEPAGKPAIDEKPATEIPFLNSSGVPYEGERGQKTSPKIVTDTVRLSEGFGSMGLNAERGRGRLSVVPSSSGDIHVLGIVPIVTDSTQDVPAYGAWMNRKLNQLNIQSSDTSDTRLVQVSFMVQ